mmetsp:Transcript_2726/g.11692  ORF Transcript_2726/g.11692 Transcript_2726/m.11692 type:complete len:267 (+) Transcript_2726:1658-2458(+)
MFTPVDLRRSAPGADSNSPGPGLPPLRTAASNTPPGASFPDAFPMFTADRAGFVRSSWYSPGPGASSGQTAAPPGASCPVTGIFTPGAADFPPPRPRPAVSSSGQCSPGPGTSRREPSNTPPGASFPVPRAMFTPVDLLRMAPGTGSNSPGPGPPRVAASKTPPGASLPAPLPMFTPVLATRGASRWYSPGPGRRSADVRDRSRLSATIVAPFRGSGARTTSPAYSPGPGAPSPEPRRSEASFRRSPMRWAGARLSITRRAPGSVS